MTLARHARPVRPTRPTRRQGKHVYKMYLLRRQRLHRRAMRQMAELLRPLLAPFVALAEKFEKAAESVVTFSETVASRTTKR